ncbi:TerB family tellurite resistance protein [Sandaracinus amylolyticus]|uniref:Co-chaperone DjlA N-terminal domain-containing protein n=1 Tax=Sandaracinus amylolyticus TaxID=927083 RepID=A0A0F6YFL1_9BACT|nr:TerB family tellurite resistance protein [Sandaracinus amylolyticus]AKF03703.1 hypothetical protein DB32_000852 [Sandaracinus amylolyticus]
MDFTQLNPQERLALAALVRTMLRLDRSYSSEESERLHAIAEELGDPEAFWEAIERAAQSVTNERELEAVTRGVTRPESRELMLDVLESVAAAEVESSAELKMLADLRALWNMPAPA